MKVDTSKLKRGSSELTPECRQLIEQISRCRNRAEILHFLETVNVWLYGKCELYHWIDILDRFDKVLEEAARTAEGNEFMLHCDHTFSPEDTRLLLLMLNFTTLLIEHSFSRHLYNSIEHLTQLLSSQNMDIVLAVLNLLYMFSKRSNFIPRLSYEKKEMLLTKLFNIAERWGDPNYGLALVDCCIRKPKLEFLYQLSIEYTDESGQVAFLEVPDMLDICNSAPPAEVTKVICDSMSNPTDAIKMRIAHRVRLVSGFKDYKLRLQFVQARLQAISVLIYSNALQENIEKILYPGFGEELCELIDKEDVHLVEIRAAVLRTLTSMLHFDRNPNVPRPGSRLSKIIQYTGAERQGGILPLLVRDCIASLTGDSPCEKYPLVLATSLFSLLYHLASYEAGGQALIKSGMMQSLLRVISWPGVDLEHITFVTRAVRVIDLITSIDIAKFHQNNGLNVFIDRLEKEVNSCREALAEVEQSHSSTQDTHVGMSARSEASLTEGSESVEAMVDDAAPLSIDAVEQRSHFEGDIILLHDSTSNPSSTADPPIHFERNMDNIDLDSDSAHFGSVERPAPVRYPSNSYYARPLIERNIEYSSAVASQSKKLTCVTQRAALLKSMLNFLKKSIQDHAHFNGMRNIMETSLPNSLRHIISNAEYYGPSLFLLATDVVTVYVFNEPSLLSSLQDSGITNVMLQSLLQKDVPATREVLGSMPNVFSAMCLNERGLMEFMAYEPFDKLLKVLLSPDYLVAMRRRRSSDPLGDTATNLGNAMDDLMKHHPYLRTDATEAIVRLLNELVRLGSDSNFICWRANKDNNSAAASSNNAANQITNQANQNFGNAAASNELGNNENENDSSGEDDDDDDEMSSASQQQQRQNRTAVEHQQMQARATTNQQEREAIPLIDYILNVMKFIDAIFSNSSNGDHCREFVMHGGLKPLLQLLSLPNLPVDSPVSTTAQAVANVCKSILNLAHETKVIDTALQQLSQIIENLKPLIKHFNFPGGSVLLRELLSCPKLDDGFSIADYTPLLHSMSSVHGYVVLLVHLCRNASNEMRSILLKRWGTNSGTGLQLLQSLVRLYISLVWESTILLSLCSDEPYVQNADFGWYENTASTSNNTGESGDDKPLERDEATRKTERACAARVKLKPEEQLRYIKSLLAASSRLGRALAELFGTLVKLSVGTPQSRQRRNNEYVTSISSSKFPTADAKEIARVLSAILVNGFSHEDIISKPAPKLKLTFLICSVGFTGPMLFDDKRSSFHLMISQFCEENGLKAFFEMFYWALSLDGSPNKFSFERCLKMEDVLENLETDTNDFPEGTGEFLDAWLQLLEKMVNPRAILDSPYAIAPRVAHMPEIVHFEPIFYLIQVHQLALQTIRRIWKRKPIQNYGLSMTETIMAILKHLVKSHNMLAERYETRLNEIENAADLLDQCKKPARPPEQANVNAGHFKLLTDMGFSYHSVLEALRNTRSLEQATDYLLTHAETSTSSVPPPDFGSADMEVDMEGAGASAATPSTSNAASEKASGSKFNYMDIKLLPNEIFDTFCEETLERTFAFMEYLPETVNTGTELISALYHRNNQWDKLTYEMNFVANLVKSLTDCTEHILKGLRQEYVLISSDLEEYTTAIKLVIRLRVATLLLDETYSDIRQEFCAAIAKGEYLNSLIQLLHRAESLLEEQVALGREPVVPLWLRNLIKFIDAIDNVCVILQRRENMRAVCNENWKWYDASTGKWNSYTESNNALIRKAFNFGERSVAISIGRQRYTINFNCMTQVSEASGSHRPVLPALKIVDAIAALSNSNANPKVENILTRTIKAKGDGSGGTAKHDEVICLRTLMNFADETGVTEEFHFAEDLKAESAKKRDGATSRATNLNTEGDVDLNATPCNSKKQKSKSSSESSSKKTPTTLKRVQKIVLHEEPVGLAAMDEFISCLVRLLQPALLPNSEIKLSILKLCARLTKDYENAKLFHKHGGIKLLLNMRQTCGLMGFPTYAIVIIRHVLEAPAVLQESIEKILSTRAAQTVPAGHRDLIFLLTQVSSAVARHPAIFLAAAKNTLRADYTPNATFAIDDSRLVVKAQTANHKCGTTTATGTGTATVAATKTTDESSESIQTSEDVVKELLHAIVQPCIHYGGIITEEDQFEYAQDAQEFAAMQSESTTNKTNPSKKSVESFEPCCCSWHIPSSNHTHRKPVLPRSTLLKTLADAVRSYQSLVPRLIIEHVYTPADSPLIEKEQSCLSFILDNFLPIVRRQQDSEVSMMSRVLISSLADCFSYPAVQTKVVEEIHDALVRVLTKHNNTRGDTEKHTRLQVLIGLLPVMIESPMLSNKMHVQRNNMYRILLRQGIMTDLAKIAQYKDLSNSNTLTTIYSILRPMEILLRLTIAPGSLSSRRIFFGTAPQGTSSIVNRRFFPRLATRASNGAGSASVGGEHVLRDIIRNVLSDRRHTFDFILNSDEIFLDSEETGGGNAANADDELEDNDGEGNAIPASASVRPQLNFDRLWDGLLQSDGLRLINRNTNISNNASGTNSNNGNEHHRHRNNDESNNADNGVGGGSDGASTSSEIVAAVVDNATSLLGDVTTSESDSDSNVSTENERNDEDEDDDDDDEDGNEEAIEDRSETDADEETRQFIEVFDHIYEPESSETASNDADVDADDEASELGGRGGALSTAPDASNVTESRETSSSETHMPTEGEQNEQNARGLSSAGEPPEVDATLSSETVNNTLTQTFNNEAGPSESRNSLRTTPATDWVPPRVSLSRNESIYRTSIDLGVTNTITISNERNDNRAATGTATVYMNSTAGNSLPSGGGLQRRLLGESTRRLVFLDQQYCAPMPSFTNPTEEGQLELFNQDALHWWLEEAKHLDLESQTDACLYVAHLVIPFLIKELKATRGQKKTEATNNMSSFSTSSNRRSAIPVLIQQSISSAGATPNNTTQAINAVTNTRNVDTTTSTNLTQDAEASQFRVPQLLSLTGSTSLPRFEQQQRQSSNQTNVLGEVECSSEDENPAVSDTNDDDVDDDEEDDYEDEEDLDEDDDINFLGEDVFNSTFNIDFDNDEQSELQQADMTTAENLVRENSAEPSAAPEEISENYSISAADEEQDYDDPAANNAGIVVTPELTTPPTTTPVASASASASDIEASLTPATINAMNEEPAALIVEPPSTAEADEATAASIPVEIPPPPSTQPAGEAADNNTADMAGAAALAIPASNTTTVSGSTNNQQAAMSPEVRAALGDLEVPEGVDPSFLAALPREMREEVITEHLRMQRIRQRAQQNAIQVAHDSLVEVNPEFLAALPPNIQSEVLMQQRIEQQRHAAQSANPDEPVDTAAFFQNLPESLRQTILTDMEESQIASLPPDLAAEAQFLRRDWETRNGSRLDAAQSNPLNGYLTGRFPSSLQNLSDESRWHTNSIWYDANGAPQSQHHQHTTIVHHHQQQLHGKPIALLLMEDENNLLDPDSLATLLLFLFIEDSKINYTRFHRVIRNLCYHLPTREWIINALISIIQKTNEGKIKQTGQRIIKPKWLKLRVDAAFGYKSNVFIINKFKGVSSNVSSSNDCTISINPQAAQMIVRNCLDLLFVLAKHFPRSFVPYNRENKKKLMDDSQSASSETISSAPLSVAINTGGSSGAPSDNEISSEVLRAIFPRNHPPSANTQQQRSQSKQTETKTYDSRLDDSPSTSKAAAMRNQQKSNASASKSKQTKALAYNTNAKQFWDVLLNIDLHTHQRFSNLQAFPINSHPKWEWEEQTPDFQTFNDSPFAKLLEMLPYKVICRSPQLTDMLVKLLASLSNDLPKEEEAVEPSSEEKTPNEEDKSKASNASPGGFPVAAIRNYLEKEGDSSSDDEEKSASSQQTPMPVVKMKRKLYSKNFSQLQLIIEVLTHQCGTADGLENISKLIVNLSQCSHASNAIFLQYLTSAILGLAQEVRQAVQQLLDEIKAYKLVNNDKFGSTSKQAAAVAASAAAATAQHNLNNANVHQGIMQDRFTAENVVISAPTNIKPSCELQLPAMKKLLSPSSAQPYFLRTLKIFMQVRELFEAQENATNGNNTAGKKPTLSQIICLDDLWNTLSECLVALEESKDEYAVLVLQPTVEAFFLIHASYRKNTNKAETNANNKRNGNREQQQQQQQQPAEEETATSGNTTPAAVGGEESTNSLEGSAATAAEVLPSTSVRSSSSSAQPSSSKSSNNTRETQQKLDRQKFLLFAEKHRTVLNQILRQSSVHLSDGPFAVLVDHTRILDFDVKRKYFQTELERIDEGVRREENTVSVRRVTVFEDSFRVLYRLGPEEWKNRFYIVFEDEEGQDAGGLLREWYVIISREIFNPMYALFCVSPGDRVTYMINPSSHANPNHLSYFKFVGRVIAKAVHDNKLLECYFTRSFYKHILGKQVKYTDMESQDYEFYKGLDYLMKNDISTLGYELTFSTEVQEFGVTQVRDLIPNGRDIAVTEENKFDYVQLVCQLKMSGSIRQQLDAFLEGFYDIIPKHLISIFNEQELELLISGLPDIDIEDLKANTEYHKYTSKSIQIQWFWRALRSFDQADRAKFLQFVTGTSKVPLQGFGSLEGMNGIQKFQIHRDDRSTDRLPCAHTCFNQLDLPMYKSYEKLRSCLLKAIHECSEGFGFA